MRTLSVVEMHQVSGGLVSTVEESVEGALWGLIDGLATGTTVGGSASRSAVFGPIGQLVGVILGMVIGGVGCTVMGAVWGKDVVAEYARDFRQNYGTSGSLTIN